MLDALMVAGLTKGVRTMLSFFLSGVTQNADKSRLDFPDGSVYISNYIIMYN